ncbi:class I SAM-dependent methyltransferase [Nocardioides sp.]|uniref:class I SAM-dependent methyltransferase n=1 Tax=Nocardioides sp. TaxID=35761 RepID=UPI002ED26DC5
MTDRQGSASIEQPEYWWYRARADLLNAALGGYATGIRRMLDVGSADGPSVGWLHGEQHFTVDLDPRGLRRGTGVRASALALPFRDGDFDLVSAFDVVEHCDPEAVVLAELGRVLRPGGRLLLSVPAYQWAWSDHDVRAGHVRRYTRPRLVAPVERAGFVVSRATYGFAAVFPMFAAERLVRRVRSGSAESGDPRLPEPGRVAEKVLLALCRAEARWLESHDVPFGSSVFVAASKPV